jgi:Uma2 family endonuclease
MTTPVPTVEMEALFEPAWDIALLFPLQGQWSEEEYLALDTNRRVEFSHGYIEVQEMPTQRHQLIISLLFRLLFEYVSARELGTVLFAGLRVRLWPGKFREPDVVFMRKENDGRRHDEYWEGADLVMEVVSTNRDLDLLNKRREYAQAGIPEYWIIDLDKQLITVFHLKDEKYEEQGIYKQGETVISATLTGFSVVTDAVLQIH